MFSRRLAVMILLASVQLLGGCCASMFVFRAQKKGSESTWQAVLRGEQFPSDARIWSGAPSGMVMIGKILLYVPGFLCDSLVLPFVFLVDGYFKSIYADWPCTGTKRALCFYPAWFGPWQGNPQRAEMQEEP